MSDLDNYGFLNAKLRGMLSIMHESGVVEKLQHASSFLEAIQELRSTPYSQLALVFDKTGDIQMMEKTLFQMEIQNHREINKFLDGPRLKLANILLEKSEIENLKNVLRFWVQSNIHHEDLGFRLNYVFRETIINNINWEMIINATKWETVLQALLNTPFYGVSSKFNFERLETEGLFYLEMELDKLYYQRILEGISHLSREDRNITGQLYSIDLDLKNLLILLRYGRFYNLPRQKIEQILIPGGTLYSSSAVKKYLEDKDSVSLVKGSFPSLYSSLVSSFGDQVGQDVNLIAECLADEHYLAQIRKKEYNSVLHGYPFCMGVVLSYFYSVELTDRQIRIILNGKFYGWPQEKITEALK